MTNVILFVDFWNFQLSWRDNVRPEGGSGKSHVSIAWKDLPGILISELPTVLGSAAPLDYKGTRIYASVSSRGGGKDVGLKNFLHQTLGQMTGFNVEVRDRKPKSTECTHCNKTIWRSVEKGVDASIITDLFSRALNEAYDVAILISNDSDLVPAVKVIQDRLNKQIIHIGFTHGGHHMRTAAWGHIMLDGRVADKLKLEETTA